MTTLASNSLSLTELRKFGGVMGLAFSLVFGLVFPLIGHRTWDEWPVWPWAVAIVFWLAALTAPGALRWIHGPWMKFGAALGFINSRIILSVFFFLIVTPFGLAMRLFRKDPMARDFDSKKDTYRVIKSQLSEMKYPF